MQNYLNLNTCIKIREYYILQSKLYKNQLESEKTIRMYFVKVRIAIIYLSV